MIQEDLQVTEWNMSNSFPEALLLNTAVVFTFLHQEHLLQGLHPNQLTKLMEFDDVIIVKTVSYCVILSLKISLIYIHTYIHIYISEIFNDSMTQYDTVFTMMASSNSITFVS